MSFQEQDVNGSAAALAENNDDPPPFYPGSQESSDGLRGVDPLQKKQTSFEDDDPWKVNDLVVESLAWNELSTREKLKRVLWNYTFRQVVLILFLYLFICSLDFLGSAFRLLGGKAAGEVFNNSEIVQNPIAGLMIGVLATVLLQSSSTTTSIVVSMVGAGLLNVGIAIPIVMGANIGTSVTNTIVSIGQVGDKNQFRRAFGGATVHDMFNWLSVVVLLPLELITGYLKRLSGAIVQGIQTNSSTKEVKLLKAITEPFTKYVIKINKKAINEIATGKTWNGTIIKMEGDYLFMNVAGVWHDWVIGLLLLALSLFVLCSCLVLLVKILNSIFRGPIAVILKKFVNSDLPGACGRISTGYIAIVIGALMTMLVQSSSIFTSTLTPLVGIGVITLERMYPLTLGSNIGTTVTAILASLAQDSSTLQRSLQISMCHLFFNISGIMLWYPIPLLRKLPIYLAKKLGDTTAKYRWFAILYLILAFFVLPGIVFGLSAVGPVAAACVLSPLALLFVFITIVNVLQTKRPQILPEKLRDWEFLPAPLHSLRPYDNILVAIKLRVRRKRNTDEGMENEGSNTTDTKV